MAGKPPTQEWVDVSVTGFYLTDDEALVAVCRRGKTTAYHLGQLGLLRRLVEKLGIV